MKKRELTEFGVAVKKRLVEMGQTQRQLAEAIGIQHVYLNIIIHGQRSGKKYIKAISNYLNLDPTAYSTIHPFKTNYKENSYDNN